MAIGALPPVGAAGISPAQTTRPQAAAGFGNAMKQGLEQVSGLERHADQITKSLATGGPATVHDLMVANTKASPPPPESLRRKPEGLLLNPRFPTPSSRESLTAHGGAP